MTGARRRNRRRLNAKVKIHRKRSAQRHRREGTRIDARRGETGAAWLDAQHESR